MMCKLTHGSIMLAGQWLATQLVVDGCDRAWKNPHYRVGFWQKKAISMCRK
jgi:hypothetical protein